MRRVLDRALSALPVTQHERVWPIVLEWMRASGAGRAAPGVEEHMWERYCKLCPWRVEDFVDFLVDAGRLDLAAVKFAHMLSNPAFESSKGKSRREMWDRLVTLATENPVEVVSIDTEGIVLAGVAKYPEDAGSLWVKLASFHARKGAFDAAEAVYEEALDGVVSVRDFAIVYDAYVQFEEAVLVAGVEEEMMAAGVVDEYKEAAEHQESSEIDWRSARLNYVLVRTLPCPVSRECRF